MRQRKQQNRRLLAALLGGLLFIVVRGHAEEGYPPDYKPSKPAAQGETNVLKRAVAVADYMNEKLNAAGGKDSPQCYRNCLTIPLNEISECLEVKTTYATSESCEQDAARKMAACDPQCQ